MRQDAEGARPRDRHSADEHRGRPETATTSSLPFHAQICVQARKHLWSCVRPSITTSSFRMLREVRAQGGMGQRDTAQIGHVLTDLLCTAGVLYPGQQFITVGLRDQLLRQGVEGFAIRRLPPVFHVSVFVELLARPVEAMGHLVAKTAPMRQKSTAGSSFASNIGGGMIARAPRTVDRRIVAGIDDHGQTVGRIEVFALHGRPSSCAARSVLNREIAVTRGDEIVRHLDWRVVDPLFGIADLEGQLVQFFDGGSAGLIGQPCASAASARRRHL